MKLEFRTKIIELKEGDMIVIPKGVEHRPVYDTKVSCLFIEPDETLTPNITCGTYNV